MKNASFYAAYIVKKLWTLAAVLLVIFAVSISVLRFSLPYMDKQKDRVQNWLGSQYGVELQIGELNASWSENGPSLVLKDVFLKQDEQSPIGLEINETHIEIDFWNSIIARQFQSQRFELDGLALSVNLARIQTAESEFPIVEALENLFLEQLHRFSVRNSVVDVTTRYDQQLIQIQQLSWINKESRHQGVGQLRVVELANNSATFILDLHGGKDDLSGTFFAKGEELDLSPWLNQLIKTQNQLTQSRGNFTFWAGIDNNRVENVQVQLSKSEFAWTTPDTKVDAAIIGGNITAVPDDLGWTFNIEDLTLESNQQSLVTNWAGHIGRDGNTRFNNINPVNMQSILPVLPLVFDQSTMGFIDRLSPRARLDNVNVMLGNQFAATAAFSQIAWNQVDSLPGMSNLTGRFDAFDTQGRLAIQGVAGEITLTNILDENIFYRNLIVDAYYTKHARGISFEVPEFRLDSEQISLSQRFAFDTSSQSLSLYAQIDTLPISQVKKLFPEAYMGEDTKNYLNRAMDEGQLGSARILWHGDLNQFPFEKDQGVFQASVDLNQMTLKFHEGWPAIKELDVDLLFENEGLSMTAQKGKLQDVSLQSLSANIPSLSSGAVLYIDANAQATNEQVTRLMLDSDLADSVGVALTEGVNVSGVIQTSLDLTIPLAGEDVVAKGEATLAGNSVFVPSLGITFENAQGKVAFENDKVSFNQLNAELFGQAVKLNYESKSGPAETYLADIQLEGDWQLKPLLDKYRPQMTTYLTGQTQWQADTKLTFNGPSYAYSFELRSDLMGIESGLPSPFAKDIDQLKPFILTGSGQNQASNFSATLGEQISFEGVLPHDTMQFSRAHLAIGEEKSMSMGLGFSISANVAQADFDAWYEAISVLVSDLPHSENPVLGEPQRIYVKTDSMLIAGQKIEQLELVAKHSTDDWLLEFNADQIRASVMFYDDWLNQGIDIKADFIDLAEWQGEQTMGYQQPVLNNLPPVKFECKSCRLFGKDLGRVDFSLSRAPTGMQIDSLRMNNSNGILYASGDWLLSDQGASTHLKGELSSPDFGALLKGLGLDSGIKDSKATFNFDLNWNDSPHKFSLASLNGDIDWRLTDGYLSEVSDKGARLFSILSLQSLVRKLSLDFRDVFAKGFFYDKMRGSFQIVDGRADTRDTVIDGAAGEMVLVGYTDLNSKTLNYDIEFTPNVTSSLPLLVYWMVNPATAIAALAIDQVLTEAKVISNVRYSVTGTLDEPILTEKDRKSKEVSLPARVPPSAQNPESGMLPEELPGERVNLEVNNQELNND
ncbi:MAG: YhdP family protein [Aliiglaciecola sp.]